MHATTQVASGLIYIGGGAGESLNLRSLRSLADDRLAVAAGHIVEAHTVVVEVVEDGQAALIALTVVRLSHSVAASVGPEV